MSLNETLDQFAPDVTQTIRRFPFAILLFGLTTIGVITLMIDPLASNSGWLEWGSFGALTAAFVAVSGYLFAESREKTGWFGLALIYVIPLALIIVCAAHDGTYVLPPLLLVAAMLWLSVSPFTRIGSGDARAEIQDRFWWLNHRAVTTALIAVFGTCIIFLGIFLIDRTLVTLFSFHVGELLYEVVFPIIGLFCAPVYWLATLPKLDEFEAHELREPDFLSRAVGFLGQFVLTPLLAIYTIILLAYIAQIAVTQSLPKGTFGWMVLIYAVTGAANWLILHPDFMRSRQIVRWFRRIWFSALILPMILFFVGVFVRVDAYGLTMERVLLVGGGVWMAGLAVAFLVPRFRDIRLIPGLGAVIVLVMALGPQNAQNLAVMNQTGRLDAAMKTVNADFAADADRWTDEAAKQAHSAINYLVYQDGGTEALEALFEKRNWPMPDDFDNSRIVAIGLGIPDTIIDNKPVYMPQSKDPDGPLVSVAQTPYFIGVVYMSGGKYPNVVGNMALLFDGTDLVASQYDDPEKTTETTPLKEWLDMQGNGNYMAQPWIDFSFQDKNYRLIIDNFQTLNGGDDREISSMSGNLFTDTPD